jgi:putative hemolysin
LACGGGYVSLGVLALNSFALRSLSRARLEEAFAGAKGRLWLARLDAQISALRLTTSLLKALSYLLLVAGIAYFLRQGGEAMTLGRVFVAIAWAGVLIAVFGVAIPHAWARHASEGILRRTLPILLTLRYLLYPVTWGMQSLDVPIRRLLGRPDVEEENGEEAKQEILQAAAEGQAEGAVDADEVEMIESVMEFGDTAAVEIMTPRTDVFALPAETPWAQAAHAIHEHGHTRVPVYEENLDKIIGIIYAKDLLQYINADQPVRIADIARPPFFVPETKPLDDLLREFKSRKVHLAVVLDEYGGTAGLVSIEDVLEEIVGEISDEYDQAEEEQVRRINETTADVEGRLRVDEVNDLLDLDLPEDENYDTIAGYAIAQLGYIPKSGETLEADGAAITILQADERKISRLRVHRIETEV